MGAERPAQLAYRYALHGQLAGLHHGLFQRRSGYPDRLPAPLKSHVTVQNGQVSTFRNAELAFNQFRGPVGFEMGSRNNLRGPGYFNLDLGVGKTFPIYRESVNLKFHVDAFNALNHPNFQSPSFQNNMSLVSPPNQFATIPGTVIPNGADQAARVLQGSLRLEF